MENEKDPIMDFTTELSVDFSKAFIGAKSLPNTKASEKMSMSSWMERLTPDEMAEFQRYRDESNAHEENRMKAQALLDAHGIDAVVQNWFDSKVEGYDGLNGDHCMIYNAWRELVARTECE